MYSVELSQKSQRFLEKLEVSGSAKFNGNVTNPKQPCFNVARTGSAQLDIATDQYVDVTWDQEFFDQGSNFGTNFTAPLAGKYLLSVRIRLGQVDSAAADYTVSFWSNNAAWQSYGVVIDSDVDLSADGRKMASMSRIVHMEVNKQVGIRIYQNGGAQQTDIMLGSSFSGCLLA